MSGEKGLSLDKMNFTKGKDNHESNTSTAEETPGDAPEETPETPEDTPEETPSDTPEETPENTPEDTPSDVTPEEVPTDETPETKLEEDGTPPKENDNEEKIDDAQNKIEDENKIKNEERSRILESLGTKFSKTFKSEEDVSDHIDALTSNQKNDNDVLNDDTMKQFSVFREGRSGDVNDIIELFLSNQIQDFDDMEDRQILEYKMWDDHPTRSEEDAKFYIDEKYKLDLDSDDQENERDIRIGKGAMEEDASKARHELKEMQSKTKLKESAPVAETEEQRKLIEAENKEWEEEVGTSLSDFKSLDIVLNDKGDKFTFGLDNTESLKAQMSNLTTFFSKYVTEDGEGKFTKHTNQLRDDIAFLLNKDKIIKAIVEDAKSKAIEEHLKNRKNPSEKDKGQADKGDEDKPGMQKIAEGMKAQMN